MTDDDLSGPWVLAVGALAVGVGAVVTEGLRRLRDRETDSERNTRQSQDRE